MPRILQLVVYPLVDVAFAVAEVFAGSEAWGSLSAVAPGVEGCEGNFEVFGELLGGEERVEVVHSPTLGWDPVRWVPFECRQPCYAVAISTVLPGQ